MYVRCEIQSNSKDAFSLVVAMWLDVLIPSYVCFDLVLFMFQRNKRDTHNEYHSDTLIAKWGASRGVTGAFYIYTIFPFYIFALL